MAGRNSLDGRETLSASLFFVFGQTGYFMGPIIGGILLNRWEPVSLASMALAAAITGLWATFYRSPAAAVRPPSSGEKAPVSRYPWFFILFLALTAGFQSWTQQNVTTFLPKYLSELGQSPAQYGLLSALFMAGSALGNLLGGSLADRYGRWKVIFIALASGAIPLLILATLGNSAWLFLFILLAGLCNGSAYSAVVVIAQRLMPGGIALATGLALASIFSSGSLGALVSGSIADKIGIAPIFTLSALISLAGGLLALGLREKKPAPSLAAEAGFAPSQD